MRDRDPATTIPPPSARRLRLLLSATVFVLGLQAVMPSNKRSCLRTDPDHVWFSDHDRSHINGRY